MADGAPNDPAQHVAAPLVGGQHTVEDQEAAGADVVGDDAQRGAVDRLLTGDIGGRRDQVAEQVDVVVGVHALHDGGEALEAHAGVHRRLRQRRQRAVAGTIELHEHEVPDLDVAVAVLVRRTGRAAGNLRPVVVEDLAAGTAGSGIAHCPEVRRLAEAREARGIHADLLQPDLRGLVVVAIDGDPQPLRRDAERAGDELPGEGDGLALEVVAEAEVAEHLEERVMARGVANVLEVVVLAAGADAALAAGRARIAAAVLAKEGVLELHHAGVGK